MTIIKKLYLAITLSILCTLCLANTTKTSSGLSNRSIKLYNGDTSIFNITNINGVKVLNFGDDNTLSIPFKEIKLVVKEESEDSYNLTVSEKNKIILFKKNIKGISKVFFNKDFLLFSIFSYADEDGNNQGEGYMINLSDGSTKVFSKKLANTCNPLIMGNEVYFINGLTLIRTDLSFNIKNIYKITYSAKKRKDLTYMDKYLISRLSNQDNAKVIIDFSPDRSTEKPKSYIGTINISTKNILLK